MATKKGNNILLTLVSALLATVSLAQVGNPKREQEIASLKELIRISTDAKEVDKAKKLLIELQGAENQNSNIHTTSIAPTAIPEKTKQELDFEEQKHAAETLSPAEYDAWKTGKTKK